MEIRNGNPKSEIFKYLEWLRSSEFEIPNKSGIFFFPNSQTGCEKKNSELVNL